MKDDKKALVLFSGGKDSLIVTLRLLDSNYKVYLVTYENGCGLKTENVNNTCEVLAEEVSKQVHMICKNGYDVIAILGIEQSPSCCVNYIYTNHGMEKRKGLFMDKLCKKIEDLDIPIIGINRKYINKSLKELEKIVGK